MVTEAPASQPPTVAVSETPTSEPPTVAVTEEPTSQLPTLPGTETPGPSVRSLTVLLDDFIPQPNQENTVYHYNRLDGNRGAVNDSHIEWGRGHVTNTIATGETWGGVWMSLNHPIAEALTIDFSAVLPPQILPAYQSQITGITANIADGTPGRTFRFHGLWPHFANISTTGTITIAPGTEWSSVDTVIAAIGLLGGQSGLGMDTSATEEMIRSIDWDDMVSSAGISHGYWYEGDPITFTWDVFGGESWLVELA
jgi:hypothetical protein